MRTVTRITHGLYQTSDGWRIEKVNNLAREAGYSAGWHVYSPIGEYCNTYRTKGEALQDIPEQAEPPPAKEDQMSNQQIRELANAIAQQADAVATGNHTAELRWSRPWRVRGVGAGG